MLILFSVTCSYRYLEILFSLIHWAQFLLLFSVSIKICEQKEKKDGKVDKEKAKEHVKDFVKSYNDVLEQSKKSGSKEVEKNAKWMTDLTDTLSKTLDKVGIKVGDDKKLSFDEDKFDKAKDSTVESMFKGTYSYAGQIEAKASGLASASLMNTSTYDKDGSAVASLASLFNTNI